MPKEKRTRIGGHQSSVKIPKRSFAVQDNAVEHVEIGGAPEASANDILQSLDVSEDGPTTMTKKEKQASKREAFLQKLDISKSPYSKSHNRRVKRKAKEQVATGMSEIHAALALLEDPLDAAEQPQSSKKGKDTSMDTSESRPSRSSATSKSLKIGQGKAATLSKNQRKKVLDLERLRQPLILTNSTFASSPFSTIRVHAQNTLVKRTTPT